MRAGWEPQNTVDCALGETAWDGYEVARAAVDGRHDKAALASNPTDVGLAEWSGELESRRLRVHDGGLILEMFGTPSRTRRLFIFLSAGGGALKDGKTPQFARVSWHPWLDGVCLNVDDPTFFAFPGKLQTGWYLGTPEQDAIPSIATAVGKVCDRYGIAPEDVTVIGSSAGGTAAIKLASAVSGARAIVENPPLYPHESSSIKYLRRVGMDIESRLYRRRNDLGRISRHPASRYVILQNTADSIFIEQLNRFLNAEGLPAPRMGLNVSGSLSVYLSSTPSLSPHHAFLSVQELRSVLRALDTDATVDTRTMILDAVFEGVRTRTLAADRLSNVKGWHRLIAALDIEAHADLPEPTDADILRIRLRAHPAVVYRLRMGHKAKSVFIALDVKPEASPASKRTLEAVADAVGARLTKGRTGWRLSISNVPLEDATDRVKVFIMGTAPMFG